ncbi:2OG-Fe(II) oxygenase [Synechococcus sp. Nb3U1]|uniref:2OG-Fe(II) oxygenase n=1 Tax=Synechococcus sp. Nb3U1 TaxID=1914529 RepID=UPI001F210743|nr:2OG-Fe(II) oxygenase [Synechococcus sp. Nb3U1]MCF2970436.1 2OG-Fe(II) oxygenase [Synechococcus sp. Nb3U1]
MVSTSIPVVKADRRPRYPLSEHLQVIQPSVPVELLDAESWQGIQAIAQLLPASLTNFFGFECRLGIPEAAGDFLICLDAKEAGRNTLASAEYGASLLQSEPIWQRIHQLGQHWQSAGSLLSERVHNIWLEFDVERSGPVSTPLPSCFIGSLPIYGNPVEGDEIHHWLLNEPLTLLRGEALPTSVQATVLRCLQALPIGAYVFQVGLMLARRNDWVRLCIRDIDPDQILTYLDTIGWPGSLAGLEQLLNQLEPTVDRIDLDLDVEGSIGPKLGLECYLIGQPARDPRWSHFLDSLVALGLCLPQKREALLRYPGYVRERHYPETWPHPLQKLSQLLGPDCESVFYRGLHHIKVVYRGEQVLEAKAYLAVSQQVLNLSAARKTLTSQGSQAILSTSKATSKGERQPASPTPGFTPPFQIYNFFSATEAEQLLTYSLEQEAAFEPSQGQTYGTEDEQSQEDRNYRFSWVLETIQPKVENQIRQAVRAALPQALAELGMDLFEPAHIEVQLTAHNHGHYFKLHNDNGSEVTARRTLTFVYYFSRQPQPFLGGELRVYPGAAAKVGADRGLTLLQPHLYTPIQPRHNSIVFFPSQLWHEVRRVRCPSRVFADSRFTFNGWVYR